MVKCTLVQALRLCTGRTAHRGSRGIALLFHDQGCRRREGSASHPGRSLPSGKEPVPIVQEARWAPGPVWTGAENLAPTGIRSPDRPARIQSLYRVRYPAHMKYLYKHYNTGRHRFRIFQFLVVTNNMTKHEIMNHLSVAAVKFSCAQSSSTPLKDMGGWR